MKRRDESDDERINGPTAEADNVTELKPFRIGTAKLLDCVHAFLGRFVAYPSPHARIAHTLWIAHTHAMDAWESTPRIAFLSPEPASGKTRALEISELLVPRPVEAVNVTPAYLFRKVGDEEGRPTILYDEIDTVFGPRAKEHEEIRGLLNAGHRRGAVAGRCATRGRNIVTEEIPAYCAVALAGLGDLPNTILSRAIIVRMRRRAPSERIEPYRRRLHRPEGEKLNKRLVRWGKAITAKLAEAVPAMPPNVTDRDADVWESILAIADEAGGKWPELARDAAVHLVATARESTPSLGVRLLSDIREVFRRNALTVALVADVALLGGGGDRQEANEEDWPESLSTERLISGLLQLEESVWGDLKGKPLNDRGLSARLRKYDIKPRVVRIGGSTPRGYRREDFHEAWARYLSPLPESATSATTATEEA